MLEHEPLEHLNRQIIGNAGLYHVCCRLSLLGWNAMPTSRNAKGVDILIYSDDAQRKHAIQVKALSGPNAVSLGEHIDSLLGDFLIVCLHPRSETPQFFIMTSAEAKGLSHQTSDGNHWIEHAMYNTTEFKDRWDIIGNGTKEICKNS